MGCRCVFFKKKTSYEIYYGLVGSKMCIRDSYYTTSYNQLQQNRMPERFHKYNIYTLKNIEPVSYTHLTLPTIYSV